MGSTSRCFPSPDGENATTNLSKGLVAASVSDVADDVAFANLQTSDLTLETVYLGGNQGNMGDDPIARLLPGAGNQGGFRPLGSVLKKSVRAAVLYTTGEEIDWPDNLDPQTGIFTYYGDNKEPGRADLHDTSRNGNLLLRNTFEAAHANAVARALVPPVLLFEKAAPGRAVRFRGLLAPGAATLGADDDLTAIWRSKKGQRFQNYQAKFTVLNTGRVTRAWFDDLVGGTAPTKSPHCPDSWRGWVESRSYDALTAPSTKIVRSKVDQVPTDKPGQAILQTIYAHFAGRPHDFEKCAVALWRMIAPPPLLATLPGRAATAAATLSARINSDPRPIRSRLTLRSRRSATHHRTRSASVR